MLAGREDLLAWRGHWRKLPSLSSPEPLVVRQPSQPTGTEALQPSQNTSSPLWLDIGCHRGDVLASMARHNPGACVLGMDITLKRVYLSAQKLADQKIGHGAVIFGNAQMVKHTFAPGEVDGVILFFPDPWIRKKRQRKHRLITPTFVQNLASVMSREAFLWLKTDVREYYDSAHQILSDHFFSFQGPSSTPSVIKGTYFSIFERRCIERGGEIWGGTYLKNQDD